MYSCCTALIECAAVVQLYECTAALCYCTTVILLYYCCYYCATTRLPVYSYCTGTALLLYYSTTTTTTTTAAEQLYTRPSAVKLYECTTAVAVQCVQSSCAFAI
eukprot:Lankesteria_metandrocarpae@DN4866_c0_g1_i1.p1